MSPRIFRKDRHTNQLTFEQAVSLCQSWGFIVEPGPQHDEVSLIIDAPDHRNYSVYEAEMLPEIVATMQEVRSRNLSLNSAGNLFAKVNTTASLDAA